MKLSIILSFLLSIALFGCSDNTSVVEDEFTGNELSYDLYQSSDFPINGSVTFKERKDGTVQVIVDLDGTEGDIFHPVHLHFGDLSTPDAEIAFLLNDLKGEEGTSSTIVTTLSDETEFSFGAIDGFNGSVKVHLASSGPDGDIILASGNIGSNQARVQTGRQKVAVCRNE